MRSLRRAVVPQLLVVCLAACPRPSTGPVRADERVSEAPKQRYVPKEDRSADAQLSTAKAGEATLPKAKAAESYLAVRKAFPETTAAQEALYRAGVLYFESGDYPNARKSFTDL